MISIRLKYERDIDLLLAEEFVVSPDFSKWFLAQTTKFAGVSAQVDAVYVSKSDAAGESDLVIVYKQTLGADTFALLIENKIGANFQPRQLERYRSRVATEISKLQPIYNTAEIIVCAPLNYEKAYTEQVKEFDAFVSYESIASFFRNQKDASPRNEYRADFMEKAGAKKVKAATSPDYDEATNNFWHSVYDVASHDFPTLQMRESRYARGTTWVSFRPDGMPSMPKMVKVDLKGASGYVDLTFNNTLCPIMQPLVKEILDADMHVHRTGRASAIRLRVEPFTIEEGFEQKEISVRLALEATARLIQFYLKHRVQLDEAALAATPQG